MNDEQHIDNLKERLAMLERNLAHIKRQLARGVDVLSRTPLENQQRATEKELDQLHREIDYVVDRAEFKKKILDLQGQLGGIQLLIKAEELILVFIPRLEAEPSFDMWLFGEMYRDAKFYLHKCLEIGYEDPMVFYYLARIHDGYEKNPIKGYQYSKLVYDLGIQHINALRLHIDICQEIVALGGYYTEEAASDLIEARNKLAHVGLACKRLEPKHMRRTT